MRFLLVIFLFAFLIAGGTATGSQDHDNAHGKSTGHQEDNDGKVKAPGSFSVEISIPEKSLKVGVNTVELIVRDRGNREVEKAEVTVTPWMTEMGHASFSGPVVVEKGKGLYRVENIVLFMGGHWELRVHIKRGNEEGNVVFDFPSVRKTDEH